MSKLFISTQHTVLLNGHSIARGKKFMADETDTAVVGLLRNGVIKPVEDVNEGVLDFTDKGASSGGGPTLINLNDATAEEIAEALDGIGDTTATAIVNYRDEQGGIESLNELLENKILTEGKMDKIEKQVTL